VYGLAEDTDLSAFVGRELALVSIGSYQVALNFGGPERVRITIEGDYGVSGPGSALVRYRAAPEGAARLVELLGSTVADVKVTEHGTTTVHFADGSAIAIYDSNKHYESYQIYIGDRLIVV
jgi:hypothetical protein